MIGVLKKQNGMNIVGQGGKIILFMLPPLIFAVLADLYLAQIASLPEQARFLQPFGYFLLLLGLLFWGSAVIQLMVGFSAGNLVTNGAYGVVRNPIYASATFFLLPAVTLITGTWVYLVPSIFLYAGVLIFIGPEEEQLKRAFGKAYEDYLARVDRLIPFRGFFTHPETLKSNPVLLRRVLLACGIGSSLLYLAINIIGAIQWEGYSLISQTFSELIAVDAPSRAVAVPLAVVYAFLVYAFGLGIWQSAGQRRLLKVAACLIIAKEVFGLLATLFAPLHLRGVPGTLSDQMHGIFTLVGVLLCMFPAMGFAAAALGKKFRIYSIVTMVFFLAGGFLAGMDQPKYVANLPTPWMGLTERINIFGYLLWIMILALILLREQSDSSKLKA